MSDLLYVIDIIYSTKLEFGVRIADPYHLLKSKRRDSVAPSRLPVAGSDPESVSNKTKSSRKSGRTDPVLLSVANALDFYKTCMIRHENPPTDETVGGFAAGRSPLVGVTGFDGALAPTCCRFGS